GEPLLVAAPQPAGDAHRRRRPLHMHRVDDDAHVRVALPDRLLQVMDDGAGGGGQDRDRARQKRKLSLALLSERALGLEAALELLETRPKLAHVIELDLIGDETDGSVLGPVVDATAEYADLTV